jgi:CubicO group peptidase (beta-lactamase class C family)
VKDLKHRAFGIRVVGKDLYDALREDLALPIGMQDFKRERQYQVVVSRSQYPVKHIVLSTRDMARLGLLMLRHGQWRDRQIIPADWVRRSTSVRTPKCEIPDSDLGYGYLWWVWEDTTGPYYGAFMATGSFGQFITVLPELDMVVAHKTLPTGNVPAGRYLRLLDLLTGKQPASTAELTAWSRLPQKPSALPK